MNDFKPSKHLTKHCKQHIENLLRDEIGSRFVSVFIIELPKMEHIQLLVKTNEDMYWGDEVDAEDAPINKYLRGLGYRSVDIMAAHGFKGEWIK